MAWGRGRIFEDFEIWQDAIDLGDRLFDVAELADSKRMYKFAEQLRAAGLSISNNIAEGSGSFSKKEFCNFLTIARRSVFECANMVIIFYRRSIIDGNSKTSLMDDPAPCSLLPAPYSLLPALCSL
ncbi:MAG TPA: hypothetical protein DEQ09_09370, partial [Bacteroidales bacterium]|nr:hypothetical protein [Bacteroidales bacterium]